MEEEDEMMIIEEENKDNIKREYCFVACITVCILLLVVLGTTLVCLAGYILK